MTQSPAPVRERPGGYRRSPGGLAGAMAATLVAVLAFVAFRDLTRDNKPTPVPSVDWTISLRAARADHHLQALAPPALPSGWKASSASYTPGPDPAWHLGMLTDENKYVGIEESGAGLDELVENYVDKDADRGRGVILNGQQWQVFTDAGGDYALGRTVTEGGEPVEAQLVVGSAPDATIRELVGTLEGGRVTG